MSLFIIASVRLSRYVNAKRNHDFRTEGDEGTPPTDSFSFILSYKLTPNYNIALGLRFCVSQLNELSFAFLFREKENTTLYFCSF